MNKGRGCDLKNNVMLEPVNSKYSAMASTVQSTSLPVMASALASTTSKRRLKLASASLIVSIADPEVTQVHEHVYYMTDPEANSDDEPIPGATIVDTSSSSSSSSSSSEDDDNDSANSLEYYLRRRSTGNGSDKNGGKGKKAASMASVISRSKSPPPPRPTRSEQRLAKQQPTRPNISAVAMRTASLGHMTNERSSEAIDTTNKSQRQRSSSLSAADKLASTSGAVIDRNAAPSNPLKASAKLNMLLEAATDFDVGSEKENSTHNDSNSCASENSSDNSEQAIGKQNGGVKLTKLDTSPAVLLRSRSLGITKPEPATRPTSNTAPIVSNTSLVTSPQSVTSPSLMPRALPLSEIVPSTSSSDNTSESEDTDSEDTDSGSNVENPHLATNSRYTSGNMSSSPARHNTIPVPRPPVNPSITSWLNGIQSPPLPVPTTNSISSSVNSNPPTYPMRPPDSSSEDDDEDDEEEEDEDDDHSKKNNDESDKSATDSDNEVIGRYTTKPTRGPPAPLALKTISTSSTSASADLPLISAVTGATSAPINSSPLSPRALHRTATSPIAGHRPQQYDQIHRNPPAPHKPRREASYDPTASRRKHSMENIRDLNLSNSSAGGTANVIRRNSGKRQDLRPTFSPPPPDSPTFLPPALGGSSASPLLRPVMLRTSSSHQTSVRRMGSGVFSGPSSPSSIASASEDDDVALGHRAPELRHHSSNSGLNRSTTHGGNTLLAKHALQTRRTTRDREERRAAAEPRRLLDDTERRSKRDIERRQAEEIRRHAERNKHHDRHRKLAATGDETKRTKSAERRPNIPDAPLVSLGPTTTSAAPTGANTPATTSSNVNNTTSTTANATNGAVTSNSTASASAAGNTIRSRVQRSGEREVETRRHERASSSTNVNPNSTNTADNEERRVERKPSRRSSTRSTDRSRRGDNHGGPGHNPALAPPLPTTSTPRRSQELIADSTDEAAITDEQANSADHKAALAAVASKDMVGADGKPIQTVKAAKARVAANVAATVAASKQQEPVRKVMATIFVDNADTKHTVQLTSTMTSVDTIRMMREANQLTEDDPTWTIFELINDFGAERPLADWEIITDVLATWDASQNNGLVARKSAFRTGLSCTGLVNGFPQYMAKLSMDKNKKWQKRNFYSRDAAIYYSKDKKCKDETLFCYLTNHEAYTMTVAHPKAPTDYVFAFKSQESIRIFEKPERDYIHFVCADNVVQLREWLLCIRSIKRQMKFAESPELFTDAFAASQYKAAHGDATADSTLGSLGVTLGPSLIASSGAAPGSLLASVDLLVLAKEKEKEEEEKPAGSLLPNVFKPGSLLAEMKPVEPTEESEEEGDAITNAKFTQGSLLNDPKATAVTRPASDEEDEIHAVTFRSGTLLAAADKTAIFAKEARDAEEKVPMQFKSGSLLSETPTRATDTSAEEKHPLQFKSGTLLSETPTRAIDASTEEKHTKQFKSGSLLSDAAARAELLPEERRALATSGAGTSTLLRIDLKREEDHTERLKKSGRFKPLVDFSEHGPPKPVVVKKTKQIQSSNYKGKPFLNFSDNDRTSDDSSDEGEGGAPNDDSGSSSDESTDSDDSSSSLSSTNHRNENVRR